MADKPKTVKSVLEAGAAYLEEQKIEQPRLVCELLLSRLLRCGRLDLYLKFDTALGDEQLAAMRRGIKRVAAGEPVQYVVGQTEFRGLPMRVRPGVLIPRPETELLVDHVLKTSELWADIGDDETRRPIIADVGTGSGCIAIALAREQPAGVYIGLDTSEEALQIAAENARLNGVEGRIAFAHGELCDCVEPESVTAIVSNPPYVATEQYLNLPPHIREHEPRAALDGGPRGLSVIQAIVQDAVVALSQNGFIFLEIAEDQAEAVEELLKQIGFSGVRVHQDLAGRDRICCGRLTPPA